MDPQVSGFRQRLKSRRYASTLVILATLTLGILIGTVVSRTTFSDAAAENCGLRTADRGFAVSFMPTFEFLGARY